MKTMNAMVGHLLEMDTGSSITKQELMKVTDPPRSKGAMDRFLKWFMKADTTSEDYAALRDAGVRYEIGRGQGVASRFVKGATT